MFLLKSRRENERVKKQRWYNSIEVALQREGEMKEKEKGKRRSVA